MTSATNGTSVTANYDVPNATSQAVARPAADRRLADGTTSVNLLLPGQLYGDRVNQVDMRFAKILRFGRTRTLVWLDLYNLFNANPGLTFNQSVAAPTAARGCGRRRSSIRASSRFNATVDF